MFNVGVKLGMNLHLQLINEEYKIHFLSFASIHFDIHSRDQLTIKKNNKLRWGKLNKDLFSYLLLWNAYWLYTLCTVLSANNNLDLCIKTEPFTAGADAMVYWISWFWKKHYLAKKPEIKISAPNVTCTVFMQRFLNIFGTVWCRDFDYFWDSVR